jgi:hypothetical protein
MLIRKMVIYKHRLLDFPDHYHNSCRVSDDYEDNEKTLTNIASGQMLATYYSGDLFGDNDVTPIRLDQFVYPNVGSFMNLDHDWNIRP